jgi:NAD+ kinase
MKIALYYRHIDPADLPAFDYLCAELKRAGVSTYIIKDGDTLDSFDYLFSIGGDGTLLSSVHLIADRDIPVLGVNFGHLGFLTTAGRDNLDSLVSDLLSGRYTLEPRSLLHVVAHHGQNSLSTFALNEVYLHRFVDAPLLRTDLYVSGDFVANYAGDGLIVATPTGSTAYSLSCGGPILTPDSGCLVITPIGVHNLTLRPIIVPDTATLRLVTHAQPQQFSLGMDSRHQPLPYGTEILLSRQDFSIRLVRLGNQSFFSAIHQKLGWGGVPPRQ